jgi:cytochrome c oxidase subunit 2
MTTTTPSVWSFPLFPPSASSIAPNVDAVFWTLIALSVAILLPLFACIVYLAVKYRRGSPAVRTDPPDTSRTLELIWMLGPLAILTPLFLWASWTYFRQVVAPADALEITVVSKQWMWKFQHPGGQSEINELHVPLGQPVRLTMISQDVIHSFFVPAFRVKQDLLPGRYTSVWFAATQLGSFHLFCAEYCGMGHAIMTGRIIVVTPTEYEQWLSGAPLLASAATTSSNTADSPQIGGADRTGQGRKAFTSLGCVQCHAGEGASAPPLAGIFGSTVHLSDGRTVTADENYLRESILEPRAQVVAGFAPVMPSYRGQLSEEELLQLIAYLKSLKKGDTP